MIKFVQPSMVLKIAPKADNGGKAKVDISCLFPKKRVRQFTFDESSSTKVDFDFPLSIVDDLVPELERVGPSRWVNRRTADVMSLGEIISRYADHFPRSFLPTEPRFPRWLNDILDNFVVHFIETQRLSAPSPKERRKAIARGAKESVVEQLSRDMCSEIQQVIRRYGSLAASLDRTFPHRLLRTHTKQVDEDSEIRQHYDRQAQYRARLMKAGLLDPEEAVQLPENELNEDERRVLWSYMQDVDEKFEVFDGLLKKVELFTEIINSRFQFKTLSIDKAIGFVFRSRNDLPIPLTSLSSGEQHELVLAYELLFRVASNSLILIDEPELSLHVTWQQRFLDDMLKISKLVDLDFIVATHSPSIIHNRSDLMVELIGR